MFGVVLRVTPFTFHVYVSRTVSPSMSARVAVAVRISLSCGLFLFSETVAVGAVFAMVTALEVSGLPSRDPSLPRTRRLIWSPLFPLLAPDRFRVALVAPLMFEPFLSHW